MCAAHRVCVHENCHPVDNTRRDFNKTTQDVFFPANSPNGAERSVSFSVFDDAIDEEPEGFIVVLYPDTNLTSIEVAFTLNLRTTLGRINDNDRKLFLSHLSLTH